MFNFLKKHLIGQYQDNVIMLYGPRRTGKSSILWQIYNDPSLIDNLYKPVYIDLQTVEDSMANDEIFFEISERISECLNLGSPERENFNYSYFLHDYLKKIKKELKQQKLLLLIDEYATLQDCVDDPTTQVKPTIFRKIRHLMQNYDWISYIFAGSHKIEQLNLKYWKEFTGAIYKTISFLDHISAKELIEAPVRKANIFYTPDAANRLLELSGNHPYFLQALCQYLYPKAEEKRRVEYDDIEMAIQPCISWIKMAFESIWREMVENEKLILSTISSIDSERVTISDISRQLDYFKVNWTLEQIKETINQLLVKDVLKQSNELFYLYYVPFYSKCIKTYYSLDTLLDHLKIKRRKDLNIISDPKILQAQNYLKDAEESIEDDDLEKTEQIFKTAIQVCPYYTHSHIKFGKYYESLSYNDAALKIYNSVLKDYPDCIDASNAIGNMLKKENLLTNALKQFYETLKIDKKNIVALANIEEIEKLLLLEREKLNLLEIPYIFDLPIENKLLFFDREETLERLKEKITKNKSIYIHGYPKIGKTSLILHFMQTMSEDFAFIYLDKQNIEPASLEGLFFCLIKRLYSSFDDNTKLYYTSFLPKPFFQFKEMLSRFLYCRFYKTDNRKKQLILVLDNYEYISELIFKGSNDSNHELINYLYEISNEYPIIFIVLGVQPIQNKFFEKPANSGFLDFEQIGVLDISSCQNLIIKPVNEYIKYTQNAIDYIIRLSGQYPYLIQALCYELVSLAKQKFLTKITSNEIDMITQKVIEKLNTFFYQIWLLLDNNFKLLLKDVVISEVSAFSDEIPDILENSFIFTIKDKKIDFKIELFKLWLNKQKPWEEDNG